MDVDSEVMETIYHGAMEMSVEIAEERGRPYEGFKGSPLSEGKFQFDLWGHTPSSGRYDWEEMRKKVLKHGVMNSLLTALMPTASTSQILGNSECFEPFQSNVYKRTTLAGEFMVINTHLVRTLIKKGLWNADMKKRIMMNNGSVQNILDIPEDVRKMYKTVWEIPQRSIIDHAIARGPFVCQSQSMNLFMTQPSFLKLSSALMYAWKGGLKTGMYYLRSNAAVEAQRVSDFSTADAGEVTDNTTQPQIRCTEEVCTSCSS
jgi:ribonucleoside-diphosphate reductase alpha chain